MSDATKWNRIYAARPGPRPPSTFVVAQAVLFLHQLEHHRSPVPRSAVDMAGGDGRHAAAMAKMGWRTTLVDVAEQGIARAKQHADREGVSLQTIQADLGSWQPDQTYGLAVVHHFLDREFLGRLHRAVSPGGRLILCHPTTTNLERHTRPSARWLLGRHEFGDLMPWDKWRPLTLTESWNETGRHEVRFVGERLA